MMKRDSFYLKILFLKRLNVEEGGTHRSTDANCEGVQASKRTSGIIGERRTIFGSEMYGTLALYRMNHSVRRCARYATTQGKRASCNSTATVPDVHSAI